MDVPYLGAHPPQGIAAGSPTKLSVYLRSFQQVGSRPGEYRPACINSCDDKNIGDVLNFCKCQAGFLVMPQIVGHEIVSLSLKVHTPVNLVHGPLVMVLRDLFHVIW